MTKTTWADVYDIIYKNRFEDEDEFTFYESQFSTVEQPILEMACGTGRLLVQFVEEGYTVHGSDISQDMLSKTREKLQAKGLETKLYQGDSKTLSLDQKYGCIYYPFSSLQHLTGLDSQKQVFSNVYTHLQQDGKFIFDLPKPSFEYIKEKYGKLLSETKIVDGTEYKIEHWSQISNEAEMQCELNQRVIDTDSNTIVFEDTYTLSLLPKQQLCLLLEQAGFTEYTFYGDYTDEVFTDEHTRLVCVARK